MYFFKVIKEALIYILGWISQVLEAMIDWGWTGPSESAVVGLGIALIFYIKRKIFRK